MRMDQALITAASIACSMRTGCRLRQSDMNRGAIGTKPNDKLDWHHVRAVNRRVAIKRRAMVMTDRDVNAYSAT